MFLLLLLPPPILVIKSELCAIVAGWERNTTAIIATQDKKVARKLELKGNIRVAAAGRRGVIILIQVLSLLLLWLSW